VIKLNTNLGDLSAYLKDKNWLKNDETIVAVEKPGEGNMNFTLRISTNSRSFIVKQSREYVEKYPQVAAPAERVLREAKFYGLIETVPKLKQMMPTLLELDAENSVMLLEDLGKGSDYTQIYQKGKTIAEADLNAVIDYAVELHNSITVETTSKRIANIKMQELNHEHIFRYPYLMDNGIHLDDILPGLEKEALVLKRDKALKNEVEKLGELYLKGGKTLLHGDYFPGSWLGTGAGIKVIDPEFCFFGPVEFELGVTMAHLKMADQPAELQTKAMARYKASASLDEVLCKKFTAIEILRRIMGLAQLPLEIDLEKRVALMQESREILTQ
tara:strand:+ start:354 stop:1340 length:987 start_codon:yes stop_codon:yes gene_type:complete